MALPYHEDTAALIERMCRNVERQSFRLQKTKASEAILKTYDLFGLPRPKKVVWCRDIFTDEYQSAGSAWSVGSARSAESAWRAWSAGSARSAWSAWSVGSARSARSAGRARSVGSARSAGRARSAESAWSARSARSAWSAGSALDYDFDYYIFEYEYVRNPDSDKMPNEYDQQYLNYCELLMQAKEYGAGYRVEWEDTLYIVPTPLVLIDKQNRFHSEVKPAIRWKGGKSFYYLCGELFEKPLWQKIVDKSITAQEVMAIPDIDKRTIAMSFLSPTEMLKQLHGRLLHTGIKGNRLYACEDFMGTGVTEYALVMDDASTPRQFIKFVLPELGKTGDADAATAGMYQDENGHSLPLEDYLLITEEA